jgi:hypothetical protein
MRVVADPWQTGVAAKFNGLPQLRSWLVDCHELQTPGGGDFLPAGRVVLCCRRCPHHAWHAAIGIRCLTIHLLWAC